MELADSLSSRLGLRSNGEEQSLCRRNKYHMGETVRRAGVRAVKQQACTSAKEVTDFLATLTAKPLKCVVKPVQSAGTDDVFLCSSEDEALTAFARIYGKRNGLGLINESVLVQEFLGGKEYVIDKVSRDGEHKLVAIWEYDKRSINNANFVYFGMRLCRPDTEKAKAMVRYADKVLDALGILQGPSHMEVMYCSDGPCLVEVGSRCHGGEASWLPVVKECIGYTQLDAALACYLRPDAFEALPDVPKLQKYGCEAFLVSLNQKAGGVLKDIPGLEAIRNLSSFRRSEMLTQPGAVLPPTVDCFTRPGSVQMVNESEERLKTDYAKIRELEISGLFEVI